MNRFISLLAFLMLVVSLQLAAQIAIGSNEYSKNPGKISSDDFAAFKKTTTVFILQEKDYAHKEDFEKAIAKVWTVTPFKLIAPQELNSQSKTNTSFFAFGGVVISRQSRTMITYNSYLSYDLYMVEKNKRGKYEKNLFAKFMLHPDFDTYALTQRMANRKQSEFSEAIGSFLYSKAVIYNWSPAMLMGYLKTINDNIAKVETRGVFEGEEDKQLLPSLATDTLYVPDYVNIKFNMFNGDETESDKTDDDLKDAYPYPAKFVSMAALNQLIADRPNGIKYLSYIKSSTDKFVSVFDSKTGKLLYTRYTPISYNFKNKDLRKLAAAVR